MATLVASWRQYADGAAGAELARAPRVAAAVFPHEPERSVYNNALLERASAIAAMEAAYAAAGVDRFAAWVHETDVPLRRELERRGYGVDETTRAMGMELTGASLFPVDDGVLGPPDWAFDLPPGLLAGVDRSAFHLLTAYVDGRPASTALAFDHDGDGGIYNVGTAEHARRRGLATALTRLQLRDAQARGCATASVQSTPMAESVYHAAGFRDLGRILEYVPPDRCASRAASR